MKYYVNKIAQSNGEHEVHTEDCKYLPKYDNRIYLGDFTSCQVPMIEAKEYYTNVDGCYYCCWDCHKR